MRLSAFVYLGAKFTWSEDSHNLPTEPFHFTLNSKDCRISPEFGDFDSNFYLVECSSEIKNLRVSFINDPEYPKHVQQVFDENNKHIEELDVDLTDGVSFHRLRSCLDVYNTDSCLPMNTVEIRSAADVTPFLRHVTFGVVPEVTKERHFLFDSNEKTQNITLYSYDPVVMSASAGSEVFVDYRLPLLESRATDQALTWNYRPTAPEGTPEEFAVYITNRDRSMVSNYTFNVLSVTSINPRIDSLAILPGRIDPLFRPHLFTYFARVPEDTTKATLSFVPVNSRDTSCRVDNKEPVFHGSTKIPITLEKGFLSRLVRINCTAKDPAYKAQYVVEVVPQLGGSTQLAELDIYGAVFDRSFDPTFHGPYQVDLCFQGQKDFNWVSFYAKPHNPNAIVTVEQREVDSESHHSPYFNLRLGEVKSFKIEVFTKKNHVNEIYEVVVGRCGHRQETYSFAKRWANSVGQISSVVSAVRASTFMANLKFLQFLSMTNRLNALPETYDYFSETMNKYNAQCNRMGEMKNYTYTTIPDNYTLFYPPAHYAHTIQDNEMYGESIIVDAVNSLLEQIVPVNSDGTAMFDGEKNTRRVLISLVENSSYRMLLPLDRTSKRNLLGALDAEAQIHRKISTYSASLIFSAFTIGILLVGYAAAWSSYLKNSVPGTTGGIRQDFPQILHPARFWSFIIDFLLISVTQSSLGLIFLTRKQALVQVGLFAVTPLRLLWLSILMFLAVPCIFVSIGAFVLYKIRADVIWSKTLNYYHDQSCFEARAFYSILQWVPILGQLCTIEVKNVVPISRPKEEGGDRIHFNPETNVGGPWMESDPEKALCEVETMPEDVEEKGDETQQKLMNDKREIKYDCVKERVRVDIDEQVYTTMLYDNHNCKVHKRWPRACVGYNEYEVKNAYDIPVKLEIEIQLRHLMPLMQALDSYTLWIPKEQLQLMSVNTWGNLFLNSRRGGFFHWVFDRVMTFALIFLFSTWQNGNGIVQGILFLVASAALAVLNLPSAIADGTGRWYQKMHQEKEKKEEEKEFEKNTAELFSVWPFKEEEVKEQFLEMKKEKDDKMWFGLYGVARTSFIEPVNSVLELPFWNTRAFEVGKSFLTGPTMYEVSKIMVLLHALMGNRRFGLFGNRFSSFFCIFWAVTGVTLLNYNAMLIFYREFSNFLYESRVWIRRGILLCVDFIRNAINPNFIHIRDFTVWHMKLIQNEFGMHFNCTCQVSDSEKKQYSAADQIDKQRFHMHKTLYQLGPLGTWRDEVDRTMPVQMPLKQLYGKSESLDRLAATIQLVNHTQLRYGHKPMFKHNSDDDSYLSLFTDPQFVPEMGTIKVKKGHGYAVRYDQEMNQLFIRGPSLKEGKEYVASTGGPDKERRASDVTTVRTAASAKTSQSGTAEAYCTDAGVLTVLIPPGQSPNTYSSVEVTTPLGDSFHIDPQVVRVSYDKVSRHLYLRARSFFASREPYKVNWKVSTETVAVKGKGVAHQGGVLVIQLENPGIPNLDEYITLKDEEGSTCYVDPRATDSYQVFLPTTQYIGFMKLLQAVVSYFSDWKHYFMGTHPLLNTLQEAIPCTIVQCTNPLERTFRVEPNFHEAAKALNSKIEETQAKLDALDDTQQLGVVCFSVMTSGDFALFFKKNGINIEMNGKWINPLLDSNHPLFRDSIQQIQELEPTFRTEVEGRLKARLKSFQDEADKIRQWIKAYASPELYHSQLTKDSAEWSKAPPEEMEKYIKDLRGLKAPYEQMIEGFVFPLNAESKLISKKPNVEAQMLQWRHKVEQWLIQEEKSHRGGLVKLGNSHYECLLSEIMRALELTFNRGEIISEGSFRTALHFITNSRSCRGNDFMWRPDPICAHPAWVRAFQCENNLPAFHKDPIWLPCSLKVTSSALKLMMPNAEDAAREFVTPHNWKRVTGWYIPLPAFEKVEIHYTPDLPTGANPHLKTTDATIVCRKTQKMHVDDNYVRRIEDDHFDNVVTFISPVTNERDCCCLMISHVVDKQTASRFPDANASPHNDMINVHPLTIRCNQAYIEKWNSVIDTSKLAGAPTEYETDFDGKARGFIPSEEQLPSADDEEYESSYETDESPPDSAPPLKGSYEGDWLDRRYHGKGVLKDNDGKVVYDGEWINGQRWGKGKCSFTDSKNVKWSYEGNFIEDEPVGEGTLRMEECAERKKLEKSKDAAHKYQVTGFQGTFVPPRTLKRSQTAPLTAEAQELHWKYLKELFSKEDPEKVVIDINKAISFGDLDDAANQTISGYSAAVSKTHRSPSIHALTDEYLPHNKKWARLVDPNSGYESLLQRMGKGTITFADGSTYEGELKDGKPHGKGFLVCWSCNTKYDGEWSEGKPNGKGVMQAGTGNDLTLYAGEFKDGKRHGEGKCVAKGGAVYAEGVFYEDQLYGGKAKVAVSPHAPNKENYPYTSYEGELSRGLPHGEGKITFSDNASYTGEFLEGYRHGSGMHADKDGKPVVAGNWDKDYPSGRVSKIILADGTIYSGDVSKGQRNGMGELFDAKGQTAYEGLWMNDQPHGRGTGFCKDGVFEGDYKAGKRSGKGKFVYNQVPLQNGKPRVYEGSWKNDVPEGVGKYLHENGYEATFQFKNGHLDSECLKAYKSNACAATPKTGNAGTKPEATSVKSSEPEHWGKRRSTDVAGISELHKTLGTGAWDVHKDEPYKFCDPKNVHPAGARPTPDMLTSGAVGTSDDAENRVMTVTLHKVEGLKIPVDRKEISPQFRVKMAKKMKRLKPQSSASTATISIEQKLKYFFRGDRILTFELWDAKIGDLVGGTVFDITPRVAKEQFDFSETVPILRNDKTIGNLTFSIGIANESKLPSKAASSSASGLPAIPKTLSALSDLILPVGPHIKVAVHSCNNLTPLAGSGDMDPYIRIILGQFAHQTRHRLDGGCNPKFDESFSFAYQSQTEITFEVYHLNPRGKDILLGTSSFKPVMSDTKFSGNLKVLNKSKDEVGNLNVTFTVHP